MRPILWSVPVTALTFFSGGRGEDWGGGQKSQVAETLLESGYHLDTCCPFLPPLIRSITADFFLGHKITEPRNFSVRKEQEYLLIQCFQTVLIIYPK